MGYYDDKHCPRLVRFAFRYGSTYTTASSADLASSSTTPTDLYYATISLGVTLFHGFFDMVQLNHVRIHGLQHFSMGAES